MDGQRHSPSPDRQPLVPQTQQRPLSGEQSEHAEGPQSQHPEPSAEPTSPYYPGALYAGPFSSQGQVQHEADIADHRQSGFPTRDTHESASVQEARAVDWIVPVQNGGPNSALTGDQRATVGDRLKSTLDTAVAEHTKYTERAKWAGYAVNGAMFAQIIVNALVTGLSAAPSSRSTQIGVSAMGAIGTILASFLVRVRGTREPERSTTHAQNLEKFIRELNAFIQDEGYSRDRKWDPNVKAFREEFDNLQTAVHQSENGQPMSAAPQSTMGDLKSKV